MALLCFVVDVSRLHGAVLQSIQQCLLQLVNFYVLKSQRSASSKPSESSIGLCLIRMDPESNSYKLKTIAEPKAPLKLRDFHQAVINGLNSASPLLESQDGTGQVSSLSSLLEEVSPWFPESATKRIVVISNCFCEPAESFRETVLEAARRCIMIDFIELDLADHSNDQCLYPQPKLAGKFNMEIAEFDNCTFQRMHWNSATISRLVKDWLQELGSDEEGSTEVVLHFTLQDDISKVFCTFYPAILKLNDILKPCEACRCHCMALGSNTGNNRTQCPITGNELDSRDVAENCLKIGDTNILQMPLLFKPPTSSSSTCHSSVVFTVVGCVCLALLSESLLFGLPYVVVASSEADLAEFSESSNNDRVFTALCQELHSRDAGLLCTANIDMESGNETSFVCFYIFLPSQNNSLLAKRIATYEEVMPLPPAMRTITNVPDHVRESVSSLLSKMEAQNYDPIQHGRGIHSKLSKVVKESVEFRSSRLEAAQNERQFVSATKVLMTQQQEQPIGRLRKNLHDIFPKQPTVPMKPSLPLNEPLSGPPKTRPRRPATKATFVKSTDGGSAAGSSAPQQISHQMHGLMQYSAISRSNVGFQLLKKAGWKEGTGLGVAEQGALNPVDTYLKFDKRGIGAEKKGKPAESSLTKRVEENNRKGEKVKKKIISKAAKRVAAEEVRFKEQEFARAFFREWAPDNV